MSEGRDGESDESEGSERLSWSPIDGGTRLNAENSGRCWTLVHTQYAFCVLKRGAADWNYRGHRFTVVPGKVYVLEPGEVHTTVRAHVPGDFSVTFLDPAWMNGFAIDVADFEHPHFLAEGVDSPEAWKGFIAASEMDPVTQADELSQTLSSSLAVSLRGRVDEPRSSGSKLMLTRAKRALIDRYISAPSERIRLEDVVRELGVGYHRFVREFSLEFGAAPYQFVKMLRARHVLEQLRHGPSAEIPSLTALARHAGYADMPHLSRELRLHFGGSPREIARQLNPEWVKRLSDAPAQSHSRSIVVPATAPTPVARTARRPKLG